MKLVPYDVCPFPSLAMPVTLKAEPDKPLDAWLVRGDWYHPNTSALEGLEKQHFATLAKQSRWLGALNAFSSESGSCAPVLQSVVVVVATREDVASRPIKELQDQRGNLQPFVAVLPLLDGRHPRAARDNQIVAQFSPGVDLTTHRFVRLVSTEPAPADQAVHVSLIAQV